MERQDKELNRQYYDAHAQAENDRRLFELEPHRQHALELIVPWVVSSLAPGDRVLDIAGGSGAYASRIVRAAPVTVAGLDISEELVRQRNEDPLLTENVVGDMEALPFADESFDVALFVAALHHVPDALVPLREAWRVLRQGGKLLVYEPCSLRAGTNGVRSIPDEPKEFRFSLGWLEGRIREAGFDVEDVRTRRLTLRVVDLFTGDYPLRVFHAADAVDRVLLRVPGLARLGSAGMVRARKPA